MTMGQRIAEQRKKLGLSQEELGERLEVSRQAVSKWESDGAVPDVNKLIGMSKLFSVSVGWLLGVEEQPDQPEEEGFTENQLRMIEGIISRYQTKPEPARQSGTFGKILIICAIAVAVIMAAVALNRIGDMPNYGGQLSSLSANYSDLQYRLGELSQQLQELSQGERLLASYEFTATALADLSGATVRFKGVPNETIATDQAWLTVQLDGQEVASVMCRLDSTGYSAEVELPVADGYSYQFLLVHEGGDSSRQVLDDGYHEGIYISQVLTPICNVNLDWDTVNNKLKITHCWAELNKPSLLEADDTLYWEHAYLILQENGEEVERCSLLEMGDTYPDIREPYYLEKDAWLEWTADMAAGSTVEVWVEAQLSNGMKVNNLVACWSCLTTGEIVGEVQVDQW